MKKKILLLAVVFICAAILASGTLAYFTSEDQVHNVITTKAVDIQIEEWQETESGLVPYPKDKPIAVMPGGDPVSKIVTVKNLEAEAYIRAKFEIVITGADSVIMELSQETLSSIIALNINSDAWLRKDGDDEWWYYKTPVGVGASTEALFTEVVFNGSNMTNEYQNCTIDIGVKAQGVQTANNGGGVMDAAGWPNE